MCLSSTGTNAAMTAPCHEIVLPQFGKKPSDNRAPGPFRHIFRAQQRRSVIKTIVHEVKGSTFLVGPPDNRAIGPNAIARPMLL